MHHRSSIAVLACGLLTFSLGVRAAELPLAVPVEGDSFRGRFGGADSTWNLKFTDGDTKRDLSAADLTTWGSFAVPARGIQVVLAGGGLIVTDDGVEIQEEHLRGMSPTFGRLNLPLEFVAGIIFRPPLDASAGDKLLTSVLKPGARTDRLLLDNGDELAGTITAIDDRQVRLQSDGADPWEVKLDTVRAIAFNPTLIDRPRASGLRCVVGFRNGDRLTAIELITDGDQTRLTLPGGVDLAASTDSIVALQVFGGRTVYLSDLEPSSYRHISFLDLSWPFRADRSVLGAPLRADDRVYLKGLGMHSPARLTYDLDREYLRFDADVAIDDDAGRRGSVVFRVFVDDGSGTWQPRATSQILRGGQPAEPLSVDLRGVKRISLLVDFADRADELDHADWLNARLIR